MLSKFIKSGDKIDLQALERIEGERGEDSHRVYASSVSEIISEDTLEILMPMEKSKLILLPIDGKYNLIFYGENGLYECDARIVDRYKSNNVYILVVELISNLRKYQRREYYRFSCAIEMTSRVLEASELEAMDRGVLKPDMLEHSEPLKQSIIVDISGGGLRFLSTQKYEKDDTLYIGYHLMIGGEKKKFESTGKVLSIRKSENRPGVWEHRVQFCHMDEKEREQIIKYIFEEERKSRRKERFV